MNRKMVDSMRKKLRRKIAEVSQQRKAADIREYRSIRQQEPDLVEVESFKKSNQKVNSASKSQKEQDRTYNLLSRGIASHFYRNLNKLS